MREKNADTSANTLRINDIQVCSTVCALVSNQTHFERSKSLNQKKIIALDMLAALAVYYLNAERKAAPMECRISCLR